MASGSRSSVVTERVIAFLKSVPPFAFLPETELTALVPYLSLVYFPRNSVVLTAGAKASTALYIIEKGAVELIAPSDAGGKVMLDMRTEGELFGLLSVMTGDIARLDVVALEDTLAYSLPGEEAQRLIRTYSEFAAYLLRASVTKYMTRSLDEIRGRTHLVGDAERLLYTLASADLVRTKPVVCSPETTIRDAARMLEQQGGTCIFPVDEEGAAIGIVTEKDFTIEVASHGCPLDQPITNIMSAPVISVEGSDRVFTVLVQMISHNIHHVLITDRDKPVGVVTAHDLMLLQGKSPLSVAREIEQQQTISGLALAQARVGELLPFLVREGARASHITRVVAEINDHIVRRILQIAEEHLGRPPIPYCWVTLGSEGRREQTFKTDQDNALIWADVGHERMQAAARDYFDAFSAFVRRALEECGYPPCEGGYMATNERWRQSLEDWKADFRLWITDPLVRRSHHALIFFDMRPVAGDFRLFEDLAAANTALLKQASEFKSVLAWISVQVKPPLGFFRTFVVEHGGEHKHQLDLKQCGTGPIVNAARLLALDAGGGHTNTVDRLHAVRTAGLAPAALVDDMLEAFEFITMLRLERQLQQRDRGEKISNHLDPATLSPLQKNLLKDTFQTLARAQSFLQSRYQSAIWATLR